LANRCAKVLTLGELYMSAFRDWYSKKFVGNPSREIEGWCESAWDAAIEYAEALKPSHNIARDEMPTSCTECWVIGCHFDYNGVGCRNQVLAARSPIA
jgi:hypothetical protein